MRQAPDEKEPPAMAGTGRSGEPDHHLSPSDIVGILDGHPAAAAVLALCCAERLSAIAEHMARSPSAGATVRAGLDLGWSAAAGRGPGRGAIGRALSDLDHLLGSPDIEIGQLHFYLDDAICAASYALEAVRDGSLAAARNAVAQCEDTYFQLAASLCPLIGLEAQLESPIMREEAARQVRDARSIASWGGTVPAPSLAALRQAAHADGEVLVTLIRSAQPAEDPPPAEQLTLF
jgi:hypothetical protein